MTRMRTPPPGARLAPGSMPLFAEEPAFPPQPAEPTTATVKDPGKAAGGDVDPNALRCITSAAATTFIIPGKVKPKERPTPWRVCLDAGMTAKEAASARGVSVAAARSWAGANKVRWRQAETREQLLARLSAVRPTKGSTPQKATDEQIAAAYATHGSVWKAAKSLGMCGQSVHERLVKLGLSNPPERFTADEDALLRSEYEAHASTGQLASLASRLGRTKSLICRRARVLGLTNKNRAKPYLAESSSVAAKARIAQNGHPRGALGMRHSEETKEILRAKNQAWHASLSEEERAALTLKSMKARAAKSGSVAGQHVRGSWKADWREIGGRRKFFRSRWEANYARYLQWMKERGEIRDWAHEPETFWFEAIKRGVRSYLPDFRVWENDGSSRLHEVKGWMDDRSRTCLRRMAKYHPQETILLIDRRQYLAIERKVSRLIEGWEDSK